MFVIIGLVALIINIFLCRQFYFAAKEKGYVKARCFRIPFLFGPIGRCIVIALPDRGKCCEAPVAQVTCTQSAAPAAPAPAENAPEA